MIAIRLVVAILLILLYLPLQHCSGDTLTYEGLAGEGIVSGFGIRHGEPLSPLVPGRITISDN